MHGLRLSLLEWGERLPDAPSLVLLHGLIAEAVTFGKLVSALPEHLHIVAIDLPGAGFSERPDAGVDMSFSGMAAVLREALSALGLEKPVMLGHSHGGVLALRLATDDPELLRGIVLLGPAHPFSAREQWIVRFYLSPLGRLFAYALPHLPHQVHLMVYKGMPGSRAHFTAEDMAPYLHTLRTPGTVAHMLRLLGTWEADMARLADDMRAHPPEVPALVLWGEKDIVVPISTAAPLLEHLPHARMVALSDIGHVPTEEAPEACAQHMVEWLAAIEPHLAAEGQSQRV